MDFEAGEVELRKAKEAPHDKQTVTSFEEWEPSVPHPLSDVTVTKDYEVEGKPRELPSSPTASPLKSPGGMWNIVQEFEESRATSPRSPTSPKNIHEFMLHLPPGARGGY